MTEISSQAQPLLDWVVAEWTEKLAAILESMADEKPTVDAPQAGDSSDGPETGLLMWEQSFSIAEKPLVWVASPEGAIQQIGERTLRASGVETMDPTDAQNTFLEVLSQSLSALGQSLSDRLECSVAATGGGPSETSPTDVHWRAATLEFADMKLEPIWIGCSQQILDLLVTGAEPARNELEEKLAASPVEVRESEAPQGVAAPGQSKTFDLLLDVSLSVSVSFGRTFLPIREVLKLTTGSIVELDRAVNEPVEIIVNNCVIARGEVVVVEGNYGVRINQIASRHDRLKTGSTAAEAQQAISVR